MTSPPKQPDEEVIQLGTGEIDQVEPTSAQVPPKITEQPVAKQTTRSHPQSTQKLVAGPPPAPEASLIPEVVYYPLHLGKKPAISVHDAVGALSLDLKFENMSSFSEPVPGIYCVGRPTKISRASTLDPTGAELTIYYLPINYDNNNKPHEWTFDAFKAYAYDSSLKEGAQLRTEIRSQRQKKIISTSIGYGLGLAGATFAVAVSWGLKGYVDAGRFFEANLSSAEQRTTYAQSELERVALSLKNVEQSASSLNTQLTDLKTRVEHTTTNIGVASNNARLAKQETIIIDTDLISQQFLLDDFWDRIIDIEHRSEGAKQELESIYSLQQTYQERLNSWDHLQNQVAHFGETLQRRYPAYQSAGRMLGKMRKSNYEMNTQFTNYISAIKKLTAWQLQSSIIAQLSSTIDPHLFQSSVNTYATFIAENNSVPKNPNITYEDGLIFITASDCVQAVTLLSNIFEIDKNSQSKFVSAESPVCNQEGIDINATSHFKGSYVFGKKKY